MKRSLRVLRESRWADQLVERMVENIASAVDRIMEGIMHPRTTARVDYMG